jgi:hypothetical protein
MDGEKVHGKPWRDDELDAIIADYFEMLALELAGKAYVKARHSAALMARLGRSHRSVEFKHQNISAVLDELGLPWIPGYVPKLNYQNSIFDAIDRYLTNHPTVESPQVTRGSSPDQQETVFVDAPSHSDTNHRLPARLRRLVRKFDPAERDRRNRSLGTAGEEFVLDVEKRRLIEADRSDLARKIRWIAQEEGDGAGYDILSFAVAGTERLLEVKTTNGSARTPFFLSRNECELASERPSEWFIYRVHMFSTQPRIFTIAPPLEEIVHLMPENWRASF